MPNISQLSDALMDWYWNYGYQRKGAYALTRGGWLDRVVRIVSEYAAVQAAKTEYAKPTMALWGPSQSGKSTLLAQFIDAGASVDGFGGALSWDSESPARFCGDNKGGTVAVLNPYNQGADASGCVTRFQLAETVRYNQYPVEVKFASEMEILLSLAVGYLGETVGKDQNGEVVQLTSDSLNEILKMCTKGVRPGKPVPSVYALLTEVVNVVDVLIDMDLPRYVNLKKEWADRRNNILNNDSLVSDEETVIKFASCLLWDNWPNMAALYRRLHEKSCELKSMFGGKTVFCSIEMAALLLNISSARYYRDSDYVRRLVNSCGVKNLDADSVAVTKGAGIRMFRDDVDFALAQGLVSLIVVKLKESVMRNGNPTVYRMLQHADIVDFPGVANEDESVALFNDAQLDLNYTDANGVRPLNGLTTVMKRGKTASIVVSSARNLNIDVFSLLVRMPAGQQYPAKPRQLMNGIRSWFKAMGKSYNPLARDGELQMNLILTFSATLVNLVNASGTGPSGLIGVFDKLKGMGELAAPDIVNTFCVNYPQFPDGRFQTDTTAELRDVINRIATDKHFQKQFNSNDATLYEMADIEPDRFGGRVFLFESMVEQLGKSKRPELLAKKEDALIHAWNGCMAEALPGESSDTKRQSDIDKMLEALTKSDLKISAVSREILDFQNIDPECLEIIPRRDRNLSIQYVEDQIDAWLEACKRAPLQRYMGFENAEHRSRFLSYLRPRIDSEAILVWLRQIVAMIALSGSDERRECRRLVATFMVNMLFPASERHKAPADCVQLLENIVMNKKKEQKLHPSYISVIAPFIRNLEKLKDAPQNGDDRGAQPGDEQLVSILQA